MSVVVQQPLEVSRFGSFHLPSSELHVALGSCGSTVMSKDTIGKSLWWHVCRCPRNPSSAAHKFYGALALSCSVLEVKSRSLAHSSIICFCKPKKFS